MATATHEGSTDLNDQNFWSGGGGTGGKPTTGDDVVLKLGGLGLTTNLNAFTGLSVKSLTIYGHAPAKGPSGEAVEFDVDATGGTKTVDHRGSGEFFFNGASAVLKARSGALRVTGGAHVDAEIAGTGRLYLGSSATLTGTITTTGLYGAAAIVYASGTAIGTVKNDAKGGVVELYGRNVGTLTSDGPGGAVTKTFDGAQITTGGRMGGGNTLLPVDGGTIADMEFKPGSILDRRQATASIQITDSTWHEGSSYYRSPEGVTTDFNGTGSSNDSTEVGAPNPTSSLA